MVWSNEAMPYASLIFSLPHHWATYHRYLPLFPHTVEFLANTIGLYTMCKDYDSINQHSTTPPTTTGAEAGNHDHCWGVGGGGAQGCTIYTLQERS